MQNSGVMIGAAVAAVTAGAIVLLALLTYKKPEPKPRTVNEAATEQCTGKRDFDTCYWGYVLWQKSIQDKARR